MIPMPMYPRENAQCIPVANQMIPMMMPRMVTLQRFCTLATISR